IDAAVQLALLNNRSLQATYEELAIAQADLVQAGLLRNPVFSGKARFPDKGLSGTNTEFELVQSFMDLLLRPLRKKLATAQFEQAKLRVSDAVLDLAAEVKSAYYTLQGAGEIVALRRVFFAASEAAAELAGEQRRAENLSDLNLAGMQAAYHEANLELAGSEADEALAREELGRLMGVSSGEHDWRVASRLPDFSRSEPPVESLEEVALSERLDLAAAKKGVEILEAARSASGIRSVLDVEVGASSEKSLDETHVTGPLWEIEVPIFDQGRAAGARSDALLRQGKQRLAALETEIRSEVRSAWTRLLAARRASEYFHDTVIPLRERIVSLSQEQYNFMLLGPFSLLEAKQEETNARSDY
ncbi:MAG: TolC family protein, partial [Vicinamibacteria bacterium]